MAVNEGVPPRNTEIFGEQMYKNYRNKSRSHNSLKKFDSTSEKSGLHYLDDRKN